MLNILKDEAKREPKENEFRGDDGLIYCTVCKQPKQAIAKCNYGSFIHPESCECEKQQAKKEAAALEQYEKQKRIDTLKRNCFFGYSELESNHFESSFRTKAIQLCFNYCVHWREAKENNNSLVLCGGVGCGKTHLSSCIANKLIDDYQTSVRIITEYDFINCYMQNEDKETFINRLSKYSLLIFDDFGTKCFNKSKPNGYLTYINDLIDMRYKYGLPMVITTNISKTLILSKGNTIEEQRLFSRLLEMAGNPVEITTTDFRLDKAKEKTDFLNKLR